MHINYSNGAFNISGQLRINACIVSLFRLMAQSLTDMVMVYDTANSREWLNVLHRSPWHLLIHIRKIWVNSAVHLPQISISCYQEFSPSFSPPGYVFVAPWLIKELLMMAGVPPAPLSHLHTPEACDAQHDHRNEASILAYQCGDRDLWWTLNMCCGPVNNVHQALQQP